MCVCVCDWCVSVYTSKVGDYIQLHLNNLLEFKFHIQFPFKFYNFDNF